MKITKAKLKQIILEEVSSIEEYGGIYEDEAENLDPFSVAAGMVENIGTMIMEKYPNDSDALNFINASIEQLKAMASGAGNETAMSHWES